MATALNGIPLHAKTIQTNHTVQFCADQEDQCPAKTHVIGVDGRKVGIETFGITKHAHQVGEDESCQEDGCHNLDTPECGVCVMNHCDVATDVAQLLIGSREAAKSAQSMENHANENEANEDHMEPFLVGTENRRAAGNLNQIPEEILTKLNGACEGHMAEQEETKDKTCNGLCDISVGCPLAGALGILEGNAVNQLATCGCMST